MTPRRALTLVAALAVLAAAAPDAGAAFEWAATGPVGDRLGMQAVAVDPDDPQVVWVGGGSRVWVTDDGGESWTQVLQVIPPSLLERVEERAAEERAEEEDDEDDDRFSTDRADFEEEDPHADDDETTSDSEDEALRERAVEAFESDEVLRRAAGPRRLRVLGDHVYVCTDLGLWVLHRAARGLGTDRAIRFGRRTPVIDIAHDPVYGVLLATPGGLFHLDDGERATPVAGPLSGRPITALAWSGGRVVAASTDGLWEGEPGAGFEPLGIPATRQPIVDIVPLGEGVRFAVATGAEVVAVDLPPDGMPVEHDRWRLLARRLTVDRAGTLWAAGAAGVWRLAQAGWEPVSDELRDRRLEDIAAAPTGDNQLWIAGRGGAWRRVPERIRVMSDRARSLMTVALGDAPKVSDVVDAAFRANHVDAESLEVMRVTQPLAWALPEVNIRYTFAQERDEDLLAFEELEEPIITQVEVAPRLSELRILFTWDLFPVLWAAVDRENPYGGTAIGPEAVRRARLRDELREKTVSVYNTWMAKRVAALTTEPSDVLDAVRLRLEVERLEAELHGLTDGWFTPPPLPTDSPSEARAADEDIHLTSAHPGARSPAGGSP